MNNFKKNLLVFLAIALGVAIFYGNTLRNGFVFDDHGQVEANTYVHSFSFLPKIISGCIWEAVVGNCKVHYYRPLQSLSYLLTYQISPQPWVFHLINLIYLTVAVFLVFVLVKLLTKNFIIALLSALIFLAHPINSEVVNWIATVPELLYTIFILLALIFYFLYRDRKKARYLIFTCIFYGLGVFSKEPAALLPLLFLTLDLAYFRKKIAWFLHWKNFKPYVIFAGTIAAYMVLRFWVLHGFGGVDPTYKLTLLQRAYLFIDLFVLYIQKFFWPFPLNLYQHLNLLSQFSILQLSFIILVVALYLGLGVFAGIKKRFMLLFSLIWFPIFLLPSLIFFNSENLFAERYVFTSTIGFAIIAVLFLHWLWKNKKGPIAFGLIGIYILISFVIIYQRNSLWRDDVSIYTDILKKSPDADLVRYNLIQVYKNRGEIMKVKELLTQIAKRGTWLDVKRAYDDLGSIYLDEGNMLQSVPYSCRAIMIDPNFKNANTNFDYAASRIQGLDNKSFMALYDQILKGDIFKASSNKDLIIPKAKDCSLQQGCLLTFNSQLPKNEFLFPFMIVGKTPYNEVVRIRYSAFNPQTSEITLGIDHKFGNSSIHFYFPACGGVYYETETQ